MLLQQDRELEAKHQRAEKAAFERKEVEEALQEEIAKLGDTTYACYEHGFDEALAQVRRFAKGALVNLLKVGSERKLDEILATDASTSQGVPTTRASHLTLFGVEEEEEGERLLFVIPTCHDCILVPTNFFFTH